MRIKIRLFTLRCGSGSDFPFDADPDQAFFAAVRFLIKVMQICYTGLQTLHGSFLGSHGSNVSLDGFMVSLQPSRLITLIRIRVGTPNMMRIRISE